MQNKLEQIAFNLLDIHEIAMNSGIKFTDRESMLDILLSITIASNELMREVLSK